MNEIFDVLGALTGTAYAADPITCWAAGLAVFWLVGGIVVRKGGLTATFIIETFGAAATIATIPKIVWWVACVLQGKEQSQLPSPPSGTDCLLAAGGLLAIVHTVILGMAKGLDGESGKQSLLDRAGNALSTVTSGLASWRPGRAAITVSEETSAAQAERETGTLHEVDDDKPTDHGPKPG